MAKTRRAKERRRVSAKKTVENKAAGFEMSSLRMPEGVNFFQVKSAGTKRLEILPFTVGAGNPNAEQGDLYFERTFWTHRDIGPNGDTYVCPAKTADKPCPICEARAALDQQGADADTLKALLPKERQLWNVYDHGDPDRGVQVFEVSYHLFGRQLYAEIGDADEDEDLDLFADPDDGMTLKVGFAEKSWAGNKFFEASTVNFKPRRAEIDSDLLDAAVCLDDLLVVKPYDELKAIFEGTAGVDADDDDDDAPAEKPKPKRKTKPKAATAESMGIVCGSIVTGGDLDGECEVLKINSSGTQLMVEDEDGETIKGVLVADVSLVDSDDDEPEPPPKPTKAKGKKPRRTTAPPPDDDDDWDDDDGDDLDDDEPEPPPKPTKAKGKGKGKATKAAAPPEDADDDTDDWDDEDEDW